ncbi:hypothetical protein BC835DRAFT_1375077 [Cytidiella melzeri]|nr:hypothetical protein BC835DRAFT_1375077 [Cytidiella melzeri]
MTKSLCPRLLVQPPSSPTATYNSPTHHHSPFPTTSLPQNTQKMDAPMLKQLPRKLLQKLALVSRVTRA